MIECAEVRESIELVILGVLGTGGLVSRLGW